MPEISRCQECGGPTALHARWGHPLKYCSPACRSNHANKQVRERLAEARPSTCTECGNEVEQPAIGRSRRFCSDKCRRRFHNRRARRARLPLRDPAPAPRNCIHCGKEFLPTNRQKVYCHGWCVQAAYQQRKREGAPLRMVNRTINCDECGASFTAEHPNARWCSTKCHRRFWGRVQSRQRGALSTASYSDLDVFERDGWICSLCGEPVDPNASRSSLNGATIDHIVPLSLGGADAPENVAIAHRSCNRRKAALLL